MLDELLYAEITAADLLREWYPTPPLCVPLATGEWRAQYVHMIFVYQIRNWEDDETPPAWETLGVTVTDIFPLPFFRLARLLRRKQKLTEESDIVVTTQREQVRWRWIWQVGDHPMHWNMVHIRWRYEERLTVNGAPSTTWGDTNEHWWKGAVPEGYDPGINTTWPGTDWEETPLPAVPEPADPGVGITNSNEGQTWMDWVWPHRDVIALYPHYPFDGSNSLFAPGFIPGAYEPEHIYGRPKSNGVFYGRPPTPP
ncbi:hypothetical protein [Verrucomicrobium spinosum]|uniref:hypothetical protein n=1 Tax=Verrucomicrobium spinosum TaxID=2736 RepID=UPI0001746949|nr:hypothetical protein [Verrucomicrobium spinosum]